MEGSYVLRVCWLVVLMFSASHSMPNRRNKLIYIMLDGFRYDYLDDIPQEEIPGFSKLLKNGVRAEYLTPIFPSVSYPDWTTLVTGLYPESHGVVGNYFFDAQTKEQFALMDKEATGNPKWWTAEPIWVTATKANLRTAVFVWSRCDIPFDGVVPEYCEPFGVNEGSYEKFQTNIGKALQKLENGFDLIQVYTGFADETGHMYGPESDERKEAVKNLDKSITYLLNKIEEMGMTDQVNIIIVSDHGMTTTKPGSVRMVEMDDYLLTDYVENVAGAGAYANIKVKEGYVDQVYERLKSMPGVEVYRHQEIPDELHYKNNKYIHDIILKADIDTFIMKSHSPVQIPRRTDDLVSFGNHGYDPQEEKMRAIFLASGPDFKKSTTTPPIRHVDVYPLLARLLQITPLPNNGTLSSTETMLTTSLSSADAPHYFFALIFAVGVNVLGRIISF